MPSLLDLIRTKRITRVVVLLLENRSFDHMLGYLSLPEYHPLPGVEGLRRNVDRSWPDPFHNQVGTIDFTPFQLRDRPLYHSTNIPAHECDAVNVQIKDPFACGPHDPRLMKGFAYAYYNYRDSDPRTPPFDCVQDDETTWPESMGYYTSRELPVTDFLARNFLVCDRWFAPLPASTQPNRLMAMSGSTRSRVTGNSMLPQELVYDWLGSAHPWGVWSDSVYLGEVVPFFSLMQGRGLLSGAWDGRRHTLDELGAALGQDLETPSVFFLEPRFTVEPESDLSWVLLDGNDNHPPSPIANGEALLRRVWTMISQSGSWERTVLFITNDEHGGFFDHVAPLEIATPITNPDPAGAEAFHSTGVRVPAIVVSPWVAPAVCHTSFDHTSILRLLVDAFELKPSAEAGLRRASADAKAVIASAGDIACLDAPRTSLATPMGTSPLAQGLARVLREAQTTRGG